MTSTNLADFSVQSLLDVYRRRVASPLEVFEACAKRIDSGHWSGAFAALCLERAREEARVAELRYADGCALPLDGVPFVAKDIFDTAGVPTTYGSRMYAEHVPERDAEAVRRARLCGAILVGKTQMHEFAWGATSVNPFMGSSRNPWDPRRIAGGSSGGSAVALALRAVPFALGTDTGGSIRIPAAFCGVTGLKPTWGRISVTGAFPLARSLDHVGPMTRSPRDAALVMGGIAGQVAAEPVVDDPVLGMRIGICDDLYRVSLNPDVAEIIEESMRILGDLGFEIREVDIPEAIDAYPAFVTIQRAEALRTHRLARLYPDRAPEYGKDVFDRLRAATATTFEDYLDATIQRERLRAAFTRVFSEVDALVTPVSAGPPPLLGEEVVEHLGKTLDFRDLVMGFTVPQNLAGLPACAVRAGFDRLGLPVGLQFSGPAGSDSKVLGIADVIFSATPELQNRWPEAEQVAPA